MCGMKVLIHSPTSTAIPLKFANGSAISFHILIGMWLFIHAAIKVWKIIIVVRSWIPVDSVGRLSVHVHSRLVIPRTADHPKFPMVLDIQHIIVGLRWIKKYITVINTIYNIHIISSLWLRVIPLYGLFMAVSLAPGKLHGYPTNSHTAIRLYNSLSCWLGQRFIYWTTFESRN